MKRLRERNSNSGGLPLWLFTFNTFATEADFLVSGRTGKNSIRRDWLANWHGRESEAEGRALFECAVDGDLSAVVLHDAVTHRQAQPRTFADLFGGEKGIVNFGEVFGGDAAA